MSEDQPGRPGTAAFARALNVSRNAKVGFGIGAAVAVGVFALFVGVPGSEFSPVLYAGLAFVLAVGVGLLLTLVFTLGSAYRLARQL